MYHYTGGNGMSLIPSQKFPPNSSLPAIRDCDCESLVSSSQSLACPDIFQFFLASSLYVKDQRSGLNSEEEEDLLLETKGALFSKNSCFQGEFK